jgi:hypothetical protein
MKNTLIFLGGAAVGGLAATLYFKKKMIILEEDYQRIANDEINKFLNGEYDDEIRETIETKLDEIHYNKINDKIKDSLTTIADIKNNTDIKKCQVISEENGYIEAEEENTSDEEKQNTVESCIDGNMVLSDGRNIVLSGEGKNLIDIKKCQVISEENGYIEAEEENADDKEDTQVAPYIITPDEYGDDEHTTRTLTAFTDKVVLDEDNCLFDINYFGKDIMKTLYSKKNVDSSIFVRDDNEKVDYEIIKEKISFEDFNKLTDSEDK